MVILAAICFVTGAVVALRAGLFGLLGGVVLVFASALTYGMTSGDGALSVIIGAAVAPILFQLGAAFTLVIRAQQGESTGRRARAVPAAARMRGASLRK